MICRFVPFSRHLPDVRRICGMSLGLLVLLAAPAESTAQPGTAQGGKWKITIIPGSPPPVAAGKQLSPLERARMYDAVYQSIPFIRSEYRANRDYRHQATMEFLFGKMRPMVIHKHAAAPRRGRQFFPAHPQMIFDHSRGPYSRTQGLFGYQGGWPLKFYLH